MVRSSDGIWPGSNEPCTSRDAPKLNEIIRRLYGMVQAMKKTAFPSVPSRATTSSGSRLALATPTRLPMWLPLTKRVTVRASQPGGPGGEAAAKRGRTRRQMMMFITTTSRITGSSHEANTAKAPPPTKQTSSISRSKPNTRFSTGTSMAAPIPSSTTSCSAKTDQSATAAGYHSSPRPGCPPNRSVPNRMTKGTAAGRNRCNAVCRSSEAIAESSTSPEVRPAAWPTTRCGNSHAEIT